MNRTARHTGILALVGTAMLAAACATPAPEPSESAQPEQPAPIVDSKKNPWAKPELVPAERPPKDAAPPQAAKEEWKLVGPGVRIDRERGIVEVDGIVPIDAHDAAAPVVYLEAIACTPDTREHESLVVSKAKPSLVHAALLLLELEPGQPGRVGWDGTAMRRDPPTGPAVSLKLKWREGDGPWREASPADWIVNARTGKHLAEEYPGDRWLFSGSRFVQRKHPETGQTAEIYDADFAGTFIGLHTFGSEAIAWSRPMNPDAGTEAPEWIADGKLVPMVGTPVVIVITASKPAAPATPEKPVER